VYNQGSGSACALCPTSYYQDFTGAKDCKPKGSFSAFENITRNTMNENSTVWDSLTATEQYNIGYIKARRKVPNAVTKVSLIFVSSRLLLETSMLGLVLAGNAGSPSDHKGWRIGSDFDAMISICFDCAGRNSRGTLDLTCRSEWSSNVIKAPEIYLSDQNTTMHVPLGHLVPEGSCVRADIGGMITPETTEVVFFRSPFDLQ
jgi:hypothetical protein